MVAAFEHKQNPSNLLIIVDDTKISIIKGPIQYCAGLDFEYWFSICFDFII